jgi:PLP dependent protein
MAAPAGVGERLERVREAIAAAAARAGRDPADVRIVAVTKGVEVDRIREAIALGLRTLGENRVQEAMLKIDALRAERCEWHLIGHLQTNKARFADAFQLVQSVDSLRLVQALEQRLSRRLDVLVEVNVALDPQKTGAMPADVDAIMVAILRGEHLRCRGLMTIAPIDAPPPAVRTVFRRLRELRDELEHRHDLPLPELSMGMTDDFQLAVEERATMLRLGRALFGARML